MNIYKNKRVLVTGHTGFKGSWLVTWLLKLGAEVIGVSKDIPTTPSMFNELSLELKIKDIRADIRNLESVKNIINEEQPDFVFHLAAQALVRLSYEIPVDTMVTNAIGSANILNALRDLDKPVIAVMITSDKAYDNVEWVWGYRETDQIGGKDPYSASKGMAELAIKSFVDSYFSVPESKVRLAIARAGNVIGGGDWGLDRIVPDCMNSWSNNEIVNIRNPEATRPWQHVLEPLSGYLVLGAKLSMSMGVHGEAYNFGPLTNQNYSVRDLINEMTKYWGSVRWNDISDTQQHLHEAMLLKLNCDKALFDLKWRPTLEFRETVRMTVEWYKQYYENDAESIYNLTLSHIDEYTKLAMERKLPWVIG